MPERKYNSTAYRYGFNGKENDNGVKGEGNEQDYGFRIYDPRLGKFLSVDPILREYPELSSYQFASNSPIQAIDLDGLEGVTPTFGQSINDFVTGVKNWWNSPGSVELARNQERVIPGMESGTISSHNPTKGDNIFLAIAGFGSNYQSHVGNLGIPSSAYRSQKSSPQVIETNINKTPVVPELEASTHQQLARKTNVSANSAHGITETPNVKAASAYSFRRTETISGNKSANTVGKLIKIIRNGGQLDPIDVADINGKLYIVDGHHRLEASRRTNTELRYNVLSPDQLKERGYNGTKEILQAAAEVHKVNVNNKIVNQAASQ